MGDIQLIQKYFPNLSDKQSEQFSALYELYEDWNSKINVISRKDFDQFYERHVLHSLAIAKFITFQPGTSVLDVGTGGGFPGVPLAIMFPEVKFHLVDSIGKKIKVVDAVSTSLGLENLTSQQIRAEELKGKFDFIVSRAVTQLPKFIPWVRNKISDKQINGHPNGIIYLKGGDLREELKGLKYYHEVIDLTKYFDEPFFETKRLLYIEM